MFSSFDVRRDHVFGARPDPRHVHYVNAPSSLEIAVISTGSGNRYGFIPKSFDFLSLTEKVPFRTFKGIRHGERPCIASFSFKKRLFD